MNAFLPFLVAGLATGAVYGLAGLGVVLTYKTSGIFNFGYGAVAALSAYLFYFLHTEHGLPWPVSAALCLLVLAPAMGWGLELLARSLSGASEMLRVVATVGLILIVAAAGALWHPGNPPTFGHFLPQSTVRIAGVNVTWEQIILFLVSLVASAVLFWFFRAVRLGIVMRGVVDDPDLIAMSGDDPVRVRRWAWILGTGFASVAGLLLAPSQPLDGITLSTIVFAAFGAAAVGYFTNLPLTFAGGLVIGIAAAFVDKYAATVSWIGGLSPALPFLVLFVVLIVTPRGRLVARQAVSRVPVRRSYYAPPRVRLTAGALAIVALALVPTLQGGHLAVWSAALVDVMLFLSLGLLVRQSGQISLCHQAFAAVGAAAFAHFSAIAGMPWLVALLLAALVAVPVGAIIAIPAVRVSGVFLALATLGFGILAQQVFYTRDFMFGPSTMGILERRPTFTIGALDLSSDTGFYYLLLVVTVAVVALVTAIGQGRLGRLLAALSDSPRALETHGADSAVLKVIVFCLSAALAALAGAFTGMLYQFGVGTYFDWFNSIVIVAVVVIMTIGSPWYGILAAVLYAVVPDYIQGGTTNSVLQLLFGIGAVSAVYGSATMPAPLRRVLDRIGGRAPAAGAEPERAQERSPADHTAPVPARTIPGPSRELTPLAPAEDTHSALGERPASAFSGSTSSSPEGTTSPRSDEPTLSSSDASAPAPFTRSGPRSSDEAASPAVDEDAAANSGGEEPPVSAPIELTTTPAGTVLPTASVPAAATASPRPLRVPPPDRSASAPAAARTETATPVRHGLAVCELSVRFGGVTAVDGVTLTARPGAITGLIGPNGAGKTTTFNACSGLNRPTSGRIMLHGSDIARLGPSRRARRGLGRTFQRTELFDSLTVRQNVAMGCEAAAAGGNPLAHLAGSRRATRHRDTATDEALELTGITHLADTQAGLLPIGMRRLVELARVLAGPFDLLLLDEPSSGLDAHETEEFGRVLRTVVGTRGTGILLVEHDMTLIRDICDHVYVLDFGTLIFEGSPADMHTSPQVRAAYLGDAAALPEPIPAGE
ncbi:ABC transporter permease subunit [Nocardia aurantia]|uniref:Vitamin B12 import ATP-binding protein BtuD n=1 Tax=Nocardia aurantia TaxID=2585199 RepID=A0A7K0DZ78_9NOCA|nr:ATP-binding cassette domain-containing protein [Nocardia aurantia]MQY31116.1 Vitamin B12 import ATP-binding protein BtuD [Nocardia aurantia]